MGRYAKIPSRGSVPKWSNGSGCKPDVSDFAGSSPARPTIHLLALNSQNIYMKVLILLESWGDFEVGEV